MPDEITMITIDNMKIGIIGLTRIIDEVKAMKLSDENKLQDVLLEKMKTSNYVPDSRDKEYAVALLNQYKKSLGIPVEEAEVIGNIIRILGPGCYACDQLEKDVKAVLAELGIAADVEHVRDPNQITEYGMVRTPGLVINNKVVLSGQSLPRSQLKKLIEEKMKS